MSEEFLVENETGRGHFRVEIETAGERTYESVPVLDTLRVPPGKYIESKFKKGEVFVAFRNGGRGRCSVLLNPEKIVAEKVTSPSQKITVGDAYQAIVINEEPGKTEIEGRLRENKLPFSVKIYFVPSY